MIYKGAQPGRARSAAAHLASIGGHHGLSASWRVRLQRAALSFGTGTFGGRGEFFGAWGSTDVAEARRLVDICIDAGVIMFDTADVYSGGAAEEILGKSIEGKPRDSVIISTKATFRSGDGANQVGSSRYHLIDAVHKALKRLGTDYIDLFQLHGFDARRRLRRCCPRSTSSSARGRSATSAFPTSRAGTS